MGLVLAILGRFKYLEVLFGVHSQDLVSGRQSRLEFLAPVDEFHVAAPIEHPREAFRAFGVRRIPEAGVQSHRLIVDDPGFSAQHADRAERLERKEKSERTGSTLNNRVLSYVPVNIFHDVISHRLHHSLPALLLRLDERYLAALAALCHRSRFHFRLLSVFAGNHIFLLKEEIGN